MGKCLFNNGHFPALPPVGPAMPHIFGEISDFCPEWELAILAKIDHFGHFLAFAARFLGDPIKGPPKSEQ